jgi:hypothetical protein
MFGHRPFGERQIIFAESLLTISLRKIVLNNWLVNPTGNPFSWVEVDLMQEHMNYWIKVLINSMTGCPMLIIL